MAQWRSSPRYSWALIGWSRLAKGTTGGRRVPSSPCIARDDFIGVSVTTSCDWTVE
jgi:hypothetical protein